MQESCTFNSNPVGGSQQSMRTDCRLCVKIEGTPDQNISLWTTVTFSFDKE